ncbi:MAG TPA: alpha/beta hydrolase [bacterium]|nr:alpha/beta hydrolase [bacterium]HPN45689.1 alpha/beta hydrolase [bacterium]
MKIKTRIFIVIVVVIILIVAFTASYIKFRSDLQAGVTKIHDLQSQLYASQYGDVEYVLAGTGPTVLISHGVIGGIDQGMGLADLYLGQGYRFLYISRFGYLKSAMPVEPSAKLQAKVYNELLNFLQIDSVFIMGNSAGGPAALHFALDYPAKCSGLILVSSAVPGNTKALPPQVFMKAVFGSDYLYWCTVKFFGASMMKMFIPESILKTLAPAEKKQVMDTVFLSGLPITQRTKGILFDTYISNPSIDDDIPFEQIIIPTLIIHAIDDPAPPIAGAGLLAAKIPRCELVRFETGGHLILHHEDEIKRIISDFVRQ